MSRYLLTITLASLAYCASTAGVHLSEVAEGYGATSVNTTVFRSNSVTSQGDRQYTSFYDPEGYVCVARRNLNEDKWNVARTQYKGNVKDAHNVISMAVDGKGYIHLSFDHHGHPLRYVRSVAPDSLAFGELESMIGRNETNVTYPEFHSLPGGDLIFAYRDGESGSGNMVLNRYDIESGHWKRIHDILIDGEGKRNAYWQMCTSPDDRIHLSWVWRETWLVETNHDLAYAVSDDGGKTWKKSDGTAYALPITMKTAEYAWHIPRNSELINQTSMTTDASGRPMIATYWRASDSHIPQYRLVSRTDGGWKMEQVAQRSLPFSLSGGGTKMIPISRPQVVADSNTVYFIFRDLERGSRVSLASRSIDGDEWQVTDLTDFSVDAWEPTIDKNLWKEGGTLNIFVQITSQGDGEKVTDAGPTPVYILEYGSPSAEAIYSNQVE